MGTLRQGRAQMVSFLAQDRHEPVPNEWFVVEKQPPFPEKDKNQDDDKNHNQDKNPPPPEFDPTRHNSFSSDNPFKEFESDKKNPPPDRYKPPDRDNKRLFCHGLKQKAFLRKYHEIYFLVWCAGRGQVKAPRGGRTYYFDIL